MFVENKTKKKNTSQLFEKILIKSYKNYENKT